MRYATVQDVEAGFRPLSDDEKPLCDELLDEAGIVIDAYNRAASEERKRLVVWQALNSRSRRMT